MFKMNPAAKEFVPAHILRKRQEEAEHLGEQLDKVNISTNNKDNSTKKENNKESCSSVSGDEKAQDHNAKEVQDVENSSILNNKQNNSNQNSTDQKQQPNDNNHLNQDLQYNGTNHHHISDNNHESEYPEGLQQLIDEDDDDRYLLKAGENICEFNGEQFIIPGDDEEYEPTNSAAGYDFGNAEDNEDEDVCNAFEEFLENLPNQ